MTNQLHPRIPSPEKANPLRRADIDVLRILAVLLLVPFHSALIFVQDPNSIVYVKDLVNSGFLDRAAGFIHQFHMPLLFFIAGASSNFSLRSRNAAIFLKERLYRLLIPALFGLVVLIPPMTYLTQLVHGRRIGFWQHIANFWHINPDDLAGISGSFTPAHLWFIIFLFVFSLAALPLFQLLRKPGSQGFLQALAGFFERPFTIFLIAIPLSLAAAPDLLGDKNPIYYLSVFVLGFLFFTDERYEASIDHAAPFALVFGILFEVIRQTLGRDFSDWSLPWILFGVMENMNRWVWVIAILGFGRRYLNKSNPLTAYLSQAAFPFYILHLPINTLVAFFAIRLTLPLAQPALIAIKYVLIVLVTSGLTLLVYEAIRRIPILRFLIGLKAPKAKTVRVKPAPAV